MKISTKPWSCYAVALKRYIRNTYDIQFQIRWEPGKLFLDFGVVVDFFTKKETDCQDPTNPILERNPIHRIGFYSQFPSFLNDTIANIQLGLEGGMKTGKSVWEAMNRKIWIRNGTVRCARKKERVREGVSSKGGELEEGAKCYWERNTSRAPRTKASKQRIGTELRGSKKIRENKGKQESMWSRVQKDGEESRESENTVG